MPFLLAKTETTKNSFLPYASTVPNQCVFITPSFCIAIYRYTVLWQIAKTLQEFGGSFIWNLSICEPPSGLVCSSFLHVLSSLFSTNVSAGFVPSSSIWNIAPILAFPISTRWLVCIILTYFDWLMFIVHGHYMFWSRLGWVCIRSVPDADGNEMTAFKMRSSRNGEKKNLDVELLSWQLGVPKSVDS